MNDISATLGTWLQHTYGWESSPHVSLLRAWTNDVYRVTHGDTRFALKIYGIGWRTDDEIRYELDLLHHLGQNGAHVALPIPPTARAQPLGHLEFEGQVHQAVLFAWAAGEKPRPPFTSSSYYRQGVATATIHRAADGFVSSHVRSALDLDTLVRRPLASIEDTPGNDEAKATLRAIADRLCSEITHLARNGLDWGPCHGDLTFDNLHHTASGDSVWYDFDSGGPGWRAIDLQGWAAFAPERAHHWQAFLDGYRDVRPLGEEDIAAAPYLHLAQEFWSIQVELQRRVIVQGTDAISRLLSESAESLTRACAQVRLI